MKVAIVYDRVNKWGGAERVLLVLHEMFPKAPLYTSVYDPQKADWATVFPKVTTSFLQKIPFASSHHEILAPLMPVAFRMFDFSEYDLVISVTSEFAKNINTQGKTLHICYCLTPIRYLWSGYNDYFKNLITKVLTKPVVHLLRKVDIKAAKKPDVMISISSEVNKRIKKYYGRESVIIHPPVGVPIDRSIGSNRDYYLLVSRLDYGYKKVDLVISTFNKLSHKLIIVGSGRLEKKLKRLAKSNINFLGKITDKKLISVYKNAKALIMPQEEDFGIVSIEAQSLGVPVIAYKKGGAFDTVIDKKTGIFFNNQTEAALSEAILEFENTKFKVDNLLTNAKKFSKENFKYNFDKIVRTVLKTKKDAIGQ